MTFRYENNKISQGYNYIIGCDEVGRGSLAGPVVAAAVAFAPASLKLKVESLKDIRDSKLLSAEKREELSEIIKKHSLWSVAEVSPQGIDEMNIHHATLLAMKKAVHSLYNVIPNAVRNPLNYGKGIPPLPSVGRDDRDKVFIFIDGRFVIPNIEFHQQAIIDGDNKVLSIAAASIIAKVYRDNLMRKLHLEYPIYNLAQHKGYGTVYHRNAILQNGLSPIHRLSFCRNLAI